MITQSFVWIRKCVLSIMMTAWLITSSSLININNNITQTMDPGPGIDRLPDPPHALHNAFH